MNWIVGGKMYCKTHVFEQSIAFAFALSSHVVRNRPASVKPLLVCTIQLLENVIPTPPTPPSPKKTDVMLLTHVMVLAYVMVLTCFMVLARVMVLVPVMVLARVMFITLVMVLARIIVLARVMV